MRCGRRVSVQGVLIAGEIDAPSIVAGSDATALPSTPSFSATMYWPGITPTAKGVTPSENATDEKRGSIDDLTAKSGSQTKRTSDTRFIQPMKSVC